MNTPNVDKPTTETKRNEKYTGGRDARRAAALILEVLTGVRRPDEAAQGLGVTTQRYYHLETKALQGLVAALEPRPRGHARRPENVVAELRREKTRLEQEVARKQTLVRLAQRVMGLPSLTKPPMKDDVKRGKRRHKTEVRARRAISALRKSLDVPGEEPKPVRIEAKPAVKTN